MKSILAATVLALASLAGAAEKPIAREVRVVLTPAQAVTIKAIQAEYKAKRAELYRQAAALRTAEAEAIAAALKPIAK